MTLQGPAGHSTDLRPLEVRLLGTLEVLRSGEAVPLAAMKERSLLAVLALHPGELVSAERLAEALWGESPPPGAPATLQSYVSKLRRVLGHDFIQTRAPGYVFAVDPEAVDAVRFARLLIQGRDALAASRLEEAVGLLKDGLSLWRGRALAEFSYEQFAQAEASRLEELRLVATEELFEAQLALGRHGEVISDLQSVIEDHPLRERLWGQLMVALYRSGRQAEALRAFQVARTTMAEELGIDPTPALCRLEAAILAHDSSLDSPPPAASTVGQSAMNSEVARRLVGREREMRHLDASLRRALGGTGQVVLVCGEPGIGKTRLIEELALRARAAHMNVAWGRSYEAEGAPALWPWVQAITELMGHCNRESLERALAPVADEIAQVVPEVRRIVPEAEPPPAHVREGARFRLYEAVSGLLTRLATGRPLLLAIEDLHWADSPSLQLLVLLASKVGEHRILIVATYRDVDPVVGEDLGEALAGLARSMTCTRLALSGLDPHEVGQYLAQVAGSEPSAHLVAAVHSRTDGNPFYVSELGRLLQTEQDSSTAEPKPISAGVPIGIRDVIRRRVSRLPPGTRALLTAAAVVGRDFDLDLVLALSEDRERALDLIEPALENRILVENCDTRARFRFSHSLVSETLYEEMTTIARARLHLRVGEAIERLHGGEDTSHLTELAYHFFRSLPVGPVEKAFTYAIRAAEAAQAGLGYEQAEELFVRATELAQDLPTADQATCELDAQVRLSRLLMMTQGYATARIGAISARARALCKVVGDVRRVAPVLWGLAMFSLATSDFDTAEQLGDELRKRAEGPDEPLLLLASSSVLGMASFCRGELATAQVRLAQAIALADRMDDSVLIAFFGQHPAPHYRAWAAVLEWLRGEPQMADRLMSEAFEVAIGLDHEFSRAPVLLFDAMLAAIEGDVDRARLRGNDTVELAERFGFAMFAAGGRAVRGWAAARQGDAAFADAELEAALAAQLGRGSTMMLTLILGLLADARRTEGNVDEALRVVEQALERCGSGKERFWEAELHRLRGELMLTTGELGNEAEENIRRAIAVAREQGARALEARAAETLRHLNTTARTM